MIAEHHITPRYLLYPINHSIVKVFTIFFTKISNFLQKSACWPQELASTSQMEMDMPDSLSSVGTTVIYNAIAIF